MKASIITIVLCLLASVASAADRWETLQAIHWVENPHSSTRPGSHGELGPYQFRQTTWKMHTKQPFHLANDRQVADQVAVAHYEWLKAGLIRNGIKATSYNIAMAWNAGLSSVINGRAPARSRDYASRVTNLVSDLKSRQLASTR